MAQPHNNSHVKILSVVWFKVLPARFGGQKAVALFNEHLGHLETLICLCSTNNEVAKTTYSVRNELPVSKSQFINPFVWKQVYDCAKKEGITHLIIDFPYHGIAGFICQKLLGVKLIVNTHNIEFVRFRQQKKWWWGLLFHYEKWVLKKADLLFFKTAADKQTAINYFKVSEAASVVVPYGAVEKEVADKASYQKSIRQQYAIRDDEKILLFAGTLDYQPNAEALQLMNEKLIPLLNAEGLRYRILICGRNQLKRFAFLKNIKNDCMIFSGEVENVDPYFKSADVFICPVITGGGVQTKIMDALTYHLNVVCFENKMEGIKGADNKIFAVQKGNWTAYSKAVVEALTYNSSTPSGFFATYNFNSISAAAHQKIKVC